MYSWNITFRSARPWRNSLLQSFLMRYMLWDTCYFHDRYIETRRNRNACLHRISLARKTADVLLLRYNTRPVRRVRATEDVIKIVWGMLPLSSCSLYLAPSDFHPFWSFWTAAYKNITTWMMRRGRMSWASGFSNSLLSHMCLCSLHLILLDYDSNGICLRAQTIKRLIIQVTRTFCYFLLNCPLFMLKYVPQRPVLENCQRMLSQ